MSISAEPGPGISVQSRPTLAVEQRSSPESTEGTRARRAVPSQATERRAWGGAVGPRGRSAGHGPQVRFLKRQLSLPVSRMSQWWVSRSSSAVVILASAKTLGHSAKARLVDRTGARVFPSHARAKKLARAAECLVYSLTPSGVLAENHPKNRGFVGILRDQKCLKRGQKCLKRRFSGRSPVGEWSRGARSMPRVFGRGSRSQPAALVSD